MGAAVGCGDSDEDVCGLLSGEKEDGRGQKPLQEAMDLKTLPVGISDFLFPSSYFYHNHQERVEQEFILTEIKSLSPRRLWISYTEKVGLGGRIWTWTLVNSMRILIKSEGIV